VEGLPVEAELFRAGGRTDTTNLTAAFRNVAKAPKMTPAFPRDRTFVFSVTIFLTSKKFHMARTETYESKNRALFRFLWVQKFDTRSWGFRLFFFFSRIKFLLFKNLKQA
jgi:hypothetical protein